MSKIIKGKIGGWRPNSGRKPKPLKDKISYSVDMKTGCWIWSGHKSKAGYGRVKHGKHYITAHRGSYIAFVGEIPQGLIICHKCDNPSCVNPDHLFVGTHSDNSLDASMKGRAYRGEKNNASKLTEADVLKIRADTCGSTAIANDYNVAVSTITRILNGRTWGHVS